MEDRLLLTILTQSQECHCGLQAHPSPALVALLN